MLQKRRDKKGCILGPKRISYQQLKELAFLYHDQKKKKMKKDHPEFYARILTISRLGKWEEERKGDEG